MKQKSRELLSFLKKQKMRKLLLLSPLTYPPVMQKTVIFFL